jgi:GxxExxY protein
VPLAKSAKFAMKKREFSIPENRIAADVVDIAYRIHSEVGPGLLESAYLQVFCFLLRKMGYKVDTEVSVPVEFEGLRIATGFRADIIVNDIVIIELKSVKAIEDVFLKQLLTYVRLSGKRLGILINFGAVSLDGQIRRVAVGLPEE